MSDSPSYLYEFFIKTKETLETFGPYFEIDEEDIGETNPLQIWSVAEMDDGTHLMNGLLKRPAIDFYLRSNAECELVWLATTLNLRANRLLHTHRLCMGRQCFLGQAQAERIGLCQMSIQ